MKKFAGLSLAALAAFSLAACGQKADTQPAQSGESKVEASADAKDNNSGDKDYVLIGTTGPLTGAAASYGTSVKQGSEIAIKEINDAGGVKVGDKTLQLKLSFKDDEATEDKTKLAYNALMDEGMDIYLGSVTSGSSLAVTDLAKQDNILMLTPSGSALDITKNDNVFRLCFTDPLQGVTLADYVLGEGYESVAILYNNADEYSTGVYESFKKQIADKGAADKLVVEESFGNEDVDFATQLSKVKAANADVLVVPGYYDKAAFIAQQAKENGLDVDLVGSDGWDGVIAQVSDKSILEGTVFLSPFIVSDESVKGFVDSYQAAYKALPDQFAADGYDAVYVLKAAIEKAGTLDTDALVKAMTEIEVDGVTGKMSFDASGEPKKDAKFIIIEGGEYTAKK